MRLSSHTLAPFLLAGLLLYGCGAGYNHVLFTTRSNIGVDLDTEPPTAEVSVSRSEMVLEPTFEDGRTLPVSASFSASQNGFATFFYGVGSTFATGEAATAMTALYNVGDTKYESPDNQGELSYPSGGDPRKTELSAYSGEGLSQMPKRKTLFGGKKKIDLIDPGLTKPVFFGTDTSFGLKVAWNNPTSPAPQSVKVGFNRKELAWAPVSIRQLQDPIVQNADPNKNPNFRVNIPSLLATLDMNAGASGIAQGTDLKWLQYFATGRAATNLALKEAVREAMLRRSDPANAAAFVPLFDDEDTKGPAFTLLHPMCITLIELGRAGDEKAKELAARMDLLKPAGLTVDFPEYEYASGTTAITLDSIPPPLTGSGFDQVHWYYSRLADSIKTVQEILTWKDANFTTFKGDPITDLPALKKKLVDDLKSMNITRARFENDVLRNATVLNDVVSFFFN